MGFIVLFQHVLVVALSLTTELLQVELLPLQAILIIIPTMLIVGGCLKHQLARYGNWDIFSSHFVLL